MNSAAKPTAPALPWKEVMTRVELCRDEYRRLRRLSGMAPKEFDFQASAIMNEKGWLPLKDQPMVWVCAAYVVLRGCIGKAAADAAVDNERARV